MNRVLVVFSDGLLSELDSARGLVSRSAWIRQAVEDKLMKEAVAPLVPEDYEVVQVGAFVMAKEDAEKAGFEFQAEPKPKARRKKLADPPGTHRDKSIASAERRMAIKSGLIPPDRCNRGACTGTINPVSGRCLHCNQTPLKESK